MLIFSPTFAEVFISSLPSGRFTKMVPTRKLPMVSSVTVTAMVRPGGY